MSSRGRYGSYGDDLVAEYAEGLGSKAISSRFAPALLAAILDGGTVDPVEAADQMDFNHWQDTQPSNRINMDLAGLGGH